MPRTIFPNWRRDPRRALAPTAPTTSRSVASRVTRAPLTAAERASGVIACQFAFVDLAASQTALQATRNIGGTNAVIGLRAPYPGSVVGLAFESNAVKSGGTATFVTYIAGVAQSASLGWSVANSGDVATFSPGIYPFNRGDLIDVRVTTTSAFAPSTADVDIMVYISFS